MKEYKGFYTKSIDEENSVTVSVPIDGYTMNENVSCLKCKHFVPEKHGMSAWDITEERCSHKENVHYTYDYEGKHSHIIWEPEARNIRLDCELWEEKVSIISEIKNKWNLWFGSTPAR